MHAHTINTRPYFLPAVILAKNRPGDEASACGFLEIRVIIAPKWGVPNGNHMNDDVAEVNGTVVPMLPGSFLHEKEPGYEATEIDNQWFQLQDMLNRLMIHLECMKLHVYMPFCPDFLSLRRV